MINNEKLVKDFYDSFKNKDQDYRLFCQDNIEWITMDGMPNGGRYVGIKSVFEEYFPRMLSDFEEFDANPTEFLCIDDRVIVFGRYSGQTKIGKNLLFLFVICIQLKMTKSISSNNIQILK